MKNLIISLVPGTILFVLMIGMQLTSHRMYNEHSLEMHRLCLEHNSSSSDECLHITYAANAAFSSATSSHILMYLGIYFALIFPAMRNQRLEKRLKELEDKSND